MPTTKVQTWPRITATARDDGGEIIINGTAHPIEGSSADEVRKNIIGRAQDVAQSVERPVALTATDPTGDWPLIVAPDGTVSAGEAPAPPRRRRARQTAAQPAVETAAPSAPAPPAEDSPVPPTPAVSEAPVTQPVETVAHSEPAAPAEDSPAEPATHTGSPVMTRRDALARSFLTETTTEAPARTGWRGALGRIGINIKPSADELARRNDERAVSQHWPGPRTIAVVNGKGGANKTPSTILIAALLARYGGSGVLAWDNNPTRGTLGWRTEKGPHDRTVLDLLPNAEQLLAPDARAAELAHYTHHQTVDMYDVLRSHPEVLATDQRITADDYDALQRVAEKYFRLIVVDSGNDESSEPWLRMIHHADQLVVATTTREEHAESGRLLLDELSRSGDHAAHLAENAVVVVSHASTNDDRPQAITSGFAQIAREAVAIPYDGALGGRPLHYNTLAKPTQRAWLRAAAATAAGL